MINKIRHILIRTFCFLGGGLTLKQKLRVRNKFQHYGLRNKIITKKTSHIFGNKFYIEGYDNTIILGENSTIKNCHIDIQGLKHRIVLGDNVLIRNSLISIRDDECVFSVGNSTETGENNRFGVSEGKVLSIGKDCMFAHNVHFLVGDGHSILDNSTNLRINDSKDIIIGNHVWLGQDVTCLKGTVIQDNVVVGKNSLLANKIYTSNSVWAGSPAKMVKDNVSWIREKI